MNKILNTLSWLFIVCAAICFAGILLSMVRSMHAQDFIESDKWNLMTFDFAVGTAVLLIGFSIVSYFKAHTHE